MVVKVIPLRGPRGAGQAAREIATRVTTPPRCYTGFNANYLPIGHRIAPTEIYITISSRLYHPRISAGGFKRSREPRRLSTLRFGGSIKR